MNSKLRHAVCLFFDIFCIILLWILFDDFKQTLMEINDRVDIVEFGNRDGFLVAGFIFPIMHLIVIIEQLWPDFLQKFKKYKKLINSCIMGIVIAILLSGFAISSWLQNRAENAGYVYCWYVSGSSALAKTLVYTNGQELCEELEAKDRAERKRK